MALLFTGAQLQEHPEIRESMHRMRKRIFKDKMSWDVACEGELEIDEYDHDSTVYILYVEGQEVFGVWRLLPTTGSYMMADIWPDFADGYIPRKPTTWELSRWAIDIDKVGSAKFEMISANMFCTLAEYCLLNGIEELVMLQDPSITPMSNQIFAIPHVRTKPKPSGVTLAHVVAYRPPFQHQLSQLRKLFGMKAPATDVFDLTRMSTIQVAAE